MSRCSAAGPLPSGPGAGARPTAPSQRRARTARARALQYAVAEALRLPDSYFDTFRAAHQRKRDLLGDGLRAAGFEVYQPQGTYFITTDIRPLSEKDAHAFCRALPERCGVVAIPNSVFYDDPDAGRSQVRFAFCKKDDVLKEATGRLQHLAS